MMRILAYVLLGLLGFAVAYVFGWVLLVSVSDRWRAWRRRRRHRIAPYTPTYKSQGR